MAVLWPVQFSIVTLNIVVGDFCGNVFETKLDYALFGHDMYTTVVVDEFECQLKCMENNSCKSVNVHPDQSIGQRICELNNKTRQLKPADLKRKKGSTYYGSVQASCMDVSREQTRPANSDQSHSGYKGTRCQTPPVLKVFIRSEGCDDPGITPGTCGNAYIKVNGKDYSPHIRGHNVVVISAITGTILRAKGFDTFGDSSAGNHLRDFLNGIEGEYESC